MLTQMRGFTRSWVSYVLLFILAALFVLFLGNGQSLLDTLQYTGSNYLAKGRNFVVAPPELARELDLTLRGERARGNNVTQADAVEAGIHRRLLDSIIGRHALLSYADRIGVSASNAQVAARIREIPNVLNPVSQAFDEEAYAAFLRELGYTQPEFERTIRGELSTRMMMEALVAGVRAPSSFGTLAYAYNSETRVVSIAEAPASAVGAIPPATQAQIEALYTELQEQLRVPEYRALTLVYARPQDFLPRVTVSEAQLNEALESRRASLAQPEKRSYVRISAQSEAQANDASARLARGESAEAVAQALGLQAARGQDQARTQIPDARVADAVFSMQARSTRVVRGQLTPWVVVRVDAITPAAEPNLAQARDELRQAMALEQATDLLNDAVGAFEEARGGGATLAEAARQNGLSVTTIAAVDAQGRGQDGQPVAALAEQQDLIEAAFQTEEGEGSDFLPAGEADVVVGVDRIIPSTVRPLADVRDQLAQVYAGRERARRLRELGQQVVTAVRGGQSFAAAARAHRFNIVVSSRAIDRREAAQIPARGLPAQIFSAQAGDALSEVRGDSGAIFVAVVERINRPDPAEAPQEVEAGRQALQQGLAASFGEATQNQIIEQAQVRRNDALLNRLFPSGEQQNAQEQ